MDGLILWPLIPLFAILGRLFGMKGGNGTVKRLIVGVGLTALLIGLLVPGQPWWGSAAFGAALGACFVFVRDPQPDIFGGNMINPSLSQFLGTIGRYNLCGLFMVPLVIAHWGSVGLKAYANLSSVLLLWSVFAALLGRLNHIVIDRSVRENKPLKVDTNAIREIITYGALGLAVAYAESLL